MSLKHVSNPSYWTLEEDASYHFNRIKGKILNTIESLIPSQDDRQAAAKNLARMFINEEFEQLCINMRVDAQAAGFLAPEQEPEALIDLEKLSK